MGISPQIVPAIIELAEKIKSQGTVKPRVLSIGYPDILKDIKEIPLQGLEPHPDSKGISGYHGRNITVPTAESFFNALGCELVVADVKKWRGNELIIDLNLPVNTEDVGKFDLVIDPGSTEHCFNVGTVMMNYLNLTNVKGYIIHWNPHWMPNHGFYNFNPTFFYDWYLENGAAVEHQTCWELEHPSKPEKVIVVPKTERYNYKAENLSLLTIVRKIEDVTSYSWPVQTKYKKMDSMLINKDTPHE